MARQRRIHINDLGTLQHRQTDRIHAWGRVFLLLIVLGFVTILGRVIQLKAAPDERLWEAAGTTLSTDQHLMRRGDLLDIRGRLIATSTKTYDLFVDPEVVEDSDFIGIELERMLQLNAAAIEEAIIDSKSRRYVIVAKDLEDWQVDVVRTEAPRGVGLTPHLKRHYPNGEVGASVIGFVGTEHEGLGGFEQRFNSALVPTSGSTQLLRDRSRRPLWVEDGAFSAGMRGDDVRLSIDLVIQEMAEVRLRQAVVEQNAGGGRVVVLDCRTGEVLALADIMQRRPGWEDKLEMPDATIHPALNRNRCVTDPYEPGSTFKPFVWATITDRGLATPSEMFPCPENAPHRTSQGRKIRDSHYYGTVDWRTVLIKSLNSGMAMGAERLSYRQMQDAIRSFGFGQRTWCGLPGETKGLLTPSDRWGHYTQTSVCMGHEIGVTPVQMVRAFSVFCRDGSLPTLRMTAAPHDSNEHQVVRQVISAETAELTRRIMENVVTAGSETASKKYTSFGKSGTAQLPKKNGGGYFEDRYISSFIAGAPIDAPRIVVLTVIDDPDRSLGHYGRVVAGPVTRDLIDGVLSYLGVEPDKVVEGEDEPQRRLPSNGDVRPMP